MLSLGLQRSPRRKDYNLHPQSKSASRLLKSASVPKLTLEPPSPSSPPLPPHNLQLSFVLKSGIKHHAFSPDVPYPLSYHRNILACDALDHVTLRSLCQSLSTINFTARDPPKCCLDLGCGPGAWVIEAANEWPDCQFVGFDIVKLQIPYHCLSPKYSSRIRWVQGDFLKPLPFDDEYFDHVHIRHIARGVPEDKWDSVMAEVARVLKVDGSVEIFEEDIIFPVLPRSSTAAPRKGKRKRNASTTLYGSKSRSITSITTQFSPACLPEHDHAVLESLFYRVFERRFINLRPTALIMGTLNIHMRQAGGSPLINFPRPPASPTDGRSAHEKESGESSRSTTPRMFDRHHVEKITSRSSTPVPEKYNVEDGQISSTTSSSCRSTLYSEQSTPATSVAEFEHPDEGPIAFFSDAGLASVSTPGCRDAEVLSEERLKVTSGTMGLHLYRRHLARYLKSYGILHMSNYGWCFHNLGVMACREAMWDEYRMANETGDPLLKMLEWEEQEIDLPNRVKFEILMERYQSDMEAYYPMANALVTDLHWKAPLRDTRQEDKVTKQALAEARRDALILERSGIGLVPERSRLCRKARIFIGRKGAVFGVE